MSSRSSPPTWRSRAGAGRSAHFGLLLAVNFLLIYAGSRALSDRGKLPVVAGLLFAYLTTLIVVLYDTYRPIRAARDRVTLDAGNP